MKYVFGNLGDPSFAGLLTNVKIRRGNMGVLCMDPLRRETAK
jgi:hypothetical protein